MTNGPPEGIVPNTLSSPKARHPRCCVTMVAVSTDVCMVIGQAVPCPVNSFQLNDNSMFLSSTSHNECSGLNPVLYRCLYGRALTPLLHVERPDPSASFALVSFSLTVSKCWTLNQGLVHAKRCSTIELFFSGLLPSARPYLPSCEVLQMNSDLDELN